MTLDAGIDEDTIAAAVAAFRERYRQLHGHGSPSDPVEFVNLWITGAIAPPEVGGPDLEPSTRDALVETRPVCFDAEAGMVPVPFLRRDGLGPGSTLEGPAIILQADTTTVLRPAQRLVVDRAGNLIISIGGAT